VIGAYGAHASHIAKRATHMGSHIPAHMPKTPGAHPAADRRTWRVLFPHTPCGCAAPLEGGRAPPAFVPGGQISGAESAYRKGGDVSTRELAMIRQVTDPRPDEGQRVLPGTGSLAGNAHRLASLVAVLEF
jgi:hypothetical protein